MSVVLYFSHPEIESLYPLTVKEKPLPNQPLMGDEIAIRVAENIAYSSVNKLIIAYPNVSSRVKEKLLKIKSNVELTVINLSVTEKASKQLKAILNEYCFDNVILQLGSTIAPPEYYDALIIRWNEVGGDSIASVTPQKLCKEYEIYNIGLTTDFVSNRILNAKITFEDEGYYWFSGLIIVDSKFKKALEEEPNIVKALVKYVLSVESSFHLWTGSIYSVSSPYALLSALKEVLANLKGTYISSSAKVSPTALIEGPVYVDDNATIDHYSVIKGPVYVGRNAFIGAYSFVRNYVSIEEGATIGAHAEVKRSYIGPNALVGSKTYVTDSLLGENSTIRPLSVTLNYDPKEALEKGVIRKMGSIIGEGSIVDGGCIIPPKTIVPPNTIYR